MDEAPQIADIQRGYRIMFCFINVFGDLLTDYLAPSLSLHQARKRRHPSHYTLQMALFRSPTMLIAYSRARLNINIMNCIHKDNIAFKNPHELNCPRIV